MRKKRVTRKFGFPVAGKPLAALLVIKLKMGLRSSKKEIYMEQTRTFPCLLS